MDKSDQQTYFHCGRYDFDGEQSFITVECRGRAV